MNAMAATGATAVRTDTYTPLPNWYIDEFMTVLSADEFRVGAKLIRLTRGFHRPSVSVTFDSLAKLCGICRRSVIRAINGLISRGLFSKETRRATGSARCIPNLYTFLGRPQPDSVTEAPQGEVTPSDKPSQVSKPSRLGGVSEAPEQKKALPQKESKQEQPFACNHQDEHAVRAALEAFQEQQQISGRIEAHTIRAVLRLLSVDRLYEGLKFVAERLLDRRKRNPNGYRQPNFGWLLQVLRDDFAKLQTVQSPELFPPLPQIPRRGSTLPQDASEPSTTQNAPRSQTGGFVRAGSMLSGLLAGLG